MKKFIALFVAIFFLTVNYAAAQQKMTAAEKAACETDAKIPALDKFHSVIYPIWHTYWPNRDWAGFKSMVPKIEAKTDSIYKAELPGILRDKKDIWNKAVDTLRVRVASYKAAAAANDTVALLKAAENLHSQYESMVRVVNPMTQELDAFHVVLYNIYHYYMPNWDVEKLKTAVKELTAKKDILVASSLPKYGKMTPERQKNYDTRNEKYKKATAKLGVEVDNVAKVLETGDKDKTKKAIEVMHSTYQACEKIFDK
jgi:hypothetical protein